MSSRALLTSMDVWCSLRSAGGAIPERTGRYFTEVGRRQPLTILMVSLRVTPCCTMLRQHILQHYRRVRGRLFGKYLCELPRKNQQDDVEGYSLLPLCHAVPRCAV